MNKQIIFGIISFGLIMLSGCNELSNGTEISHPTYLIPTRMTSLVISPQFDGIFYANVSCRSEYEFTNDTDYLDLMQIERQEFQQAFLEIIDDRTILQLEKKIDKEGYVEIRRYYLPEFRNSFYEDEFESKINLSGYEAYCKTYDSFKFNYTYYDDSAMIKKGEYRCGYYDFRFRCYKDYPDDKWECEEEFDHWKTESYIYDCIIGFLEER